MIETERLSKRYGPVTALTEFSLTVQRGEIVALVGPNGAGKTTALKLIVGLLLPTEGRVRVAGFDVHRQSLEVKRLVAFLPDQPFLYEQLTVAEMLGFIGGMYRLDPQTLQGRCAQLLERFEMTEAPSRRISQLSYGMKSRLALIAMLLRDPQVLVMDEPFFGLDPQTLRSVKQLLRERVPQGLTVLVSTHQLAVIEDVAHRIAVLDRGRIVDIGTLSELQRRYGESHLEELFFRLTSAH
jgi:ABC-2 type transport system ATP-binding protein